MGLNDDVSSILSKNGDSKVIGGGTTISKG
jgi:hypothetical protein